MNPRQSNRSNRCARPNKLAHVVRYKRATQVVPGEGPAKARIIMVGEQPGDQEDKQGRPFVGPAGGILAKALADAGIDRNEVFVTNAVKHFKFEPRGKRRLHKRANAYEIDRCHLGSTLNGRLSGLTLSWLWVRRRFAAFLAGRSASTRFEDGCCVAGWRPNAGDNSPVLYFAY